MRNFDPIRLSIPIAFETSSILAPVTSQRADRLLMEETRCANMALEASFESSDDQTFVVSIFSSGIQFLYIDTSVSTAIFPLFVDSPPTKIRSGFKRSWTAVPSAKNSGLDNISKETFVLLANNTSFIFSAVLTGKVDFSTMILLVLATLAICLADFSTKVKSAANPFPLP